MKLSINWLKDYLDTSASVDEIAKTLTAIGLEVEGIEDPAKTLQGFVVGHVVSAEKHPDADKLQCLVVDTGKEQLKVVCGAPNARQGLYGVFAPAGSYIPGLDVTLKKTAIRGQESNGMMCSERELQLSEEHNGIIDLQGNWKAGDDAAAALGLTDKVIEINVTPNRGDCASVLGIARDLAAAGLGTLKPLNTAKPAANGASPIAVAIKDDSGCKAFVGCTIKGVKNGPSPKWLQERLKAIGLRPISTLVDITNYFCIGLNRPLHVFDADKIKGNIHVRAAKKGEKLEALNNETYDLQDAMCAVCDDSGVLGLGGVIGGVPSSVTDETVNVFLECAYFTPLAIAKTGQALQINTDARYRFERGIDPAFVTQGAELAVKIILELCGGSASELVIAGAAPDITHTVSYAPERVKLLGGMDVAPETQKQILSALGFAVKEVGNAWEVKTPSWRHDIQGAADLVEEVLRIVGYDNIPVVYVRPAPEETRAPMNSLSKRAISVRHGLAARGLLETVTWAFMESDKSDLFGALLHQNKKALTLVNPISTDMAVMRPSILPNLIDAAGKNFDRGYPDAALFEIGNVYYAADAKGQITTATGLRSGQAVPRHWAGPARNVDALDAKADALAVLEMCGVPTGNVQVTRDAPEWYHPGRSGALRLGPTVLAYFGELHPGVLATLKRDEAYAGFEVFLPSLPVGKNKGPQKPLLKPSAFQPLHRDFAFVMDAALETEKIARAIKGTDKNLITNVEIFDVYQGKGVEDGKKSVALGVTLQPIDKTMTDDEIAAVCKKIIEAVEKAGGVLRA